MDEQQQLIIDALNEALHLAAKDAGYYATGARKFDAQVSGPLGDIELIVRPPR